MKLLKFIKGRFTSKIHNIGKNIIKFSKKNVYKYSITLKGENNEFKTGENFTCNNIKIHIVGNNNKISIGKNFTGNNLLIRILGNNNNIILHDNINVNTNLEIYNHDNTNNGFIEIKNETCINGTKIFNYDDNSSIIIGEKCLFAHETTVRNSDGHTIIDENGEINTGVELIIGDNVWVCALARILKNSKIGNGSVVSMGAIVTKKFDEENVILGGIPAKIIKKNIKWDKKSVNEYIKGLNN